MKSNCWIFILVIVIIVIAFIVPQKTFAAWWNPLSWEIWSKSYFLITTGDSSNNSNQLIDVCSKPNFYYTTARVKDRDECLHNLAQKQKDYTICNKVSDKETGDAYSSRDWCIETVAEDRNDVQRCKTLKESDRRSVCISIIAAQLKTPDLCTNINFQKDYCLKGSASQTSTCQQINDTNVKIDCYNSVSAALKDDSHCDESPNKDQCFQVVASAKGDLSICQKIISDGTKDFCLYSIAINTLSLPLCEKVKSAVDKKRCLYYVALHTGNVTLCERVADEANKSWCLDYKKRYFSDNPK